jgi:hypothetical protein
MARTSTKSTTKKTTKKTVAAEKSVATSDKVVETKKTKVVEIDKDELIDVVALVPNVSYYDKKTDERYEWTEVGEVTAVPYEVIENIWKQYKDYFRGLVIKPMDERVIEKLKLGNIFEKYEIFTNPDNYTKGNIGEVIESLKKASPRVKTSVYTIIKTFITDGRITDVQSIMKLDKEFDLNLIGLVG